MRRHRNGRVRIVEGFEIVPLLAAADALITDFSSAANEFLLRDRPIIFLPTPERRQRRIQQWDDNAYRIGTMVQGEKELVAAVEDALADPGRLSAVRREAAADMFYKPGTATERAAAKVYELLELEPPAALAATD